MLKCPYLIEFINSKLCTEINLMWVIQCHKSLFHGTWLSQLCAGPCSWNMIISALSRSLFMKHDCLSSVQVLVHETWLSRHCPGPCSWYGEGNPGSGGLLPHNTGPCPGSDLHTAPQRSGGRHQGESYIPGNEAASAWAKTARHLHEIPLHRGYSNEKGFRSVKVALNVNTELKDIAVTCYNTLAHKYASQSHNRCSNPSRRTCKWGSLMFYVSYITPKQCNPQFCIM